MRRAFVNSLYLGLFLSAGMMVMGLTFSGTILRWMGTPEAPCRKPPPIWRSVSSHDLPPDVLFVFQCIPGVGGQPDSAVLPDRLCSEQYWLGCVVCGCVPLGSGRVCLGHGTGAGPVGGGGGGAAVPQISHDADAAAGPPAPWKAAAADHGAGHSHCGAVCLQQSGQSGAQSASICSARPPWRPTLLPAASERWP